jgi:hypothetical protein
MEDSMHRLIERGLVASALALCACGAAVAQGTSASKSCSLATLLGTYVFAASGHTVAAGVWVPKAIIEVLRFNGDGTLSALAVTVANRTGDGVVEPVPPGGTGEYKLFPDCTGTLDFERGPSFNIVVAPKGEEGWMIQMNRNNVFRGSLSRIVN